MQALKTEWPSGNFASPKIASDGHKNLSACLPCCRQYSFCKQIIQLVLARLLFIIFACAALDIWNKLTPGSLVILFRHPGSYLSRLASRTAKQSLPMSQFLSDPEQYKSLCFVDLAVCLSAGEHVNLLHEFGNLLISSLVLGVFVHGTVVLLFHDLSRGLSPIRIIYHSIVFLLSGVWLQSLEHTDRIHRTQYAESRVVFRGADSLSLAAFGCCHFAPGPGEETSRDFSEFRGSVRDLYRFIVRNIVNIERSLEVLKLVSIRIHMCRIFVLASVRLFPDQGFGAPCNAVTRFSRFL